MTAARTDIATRDIGDATCTDRAGIATLTGRTRSSVNELAIHDADFPKPIGRAERRYWYRLTDAELYAAGLARHRQELKPAPAAVRPGDDPDELLDAEQAADLIRVTYGTIRQYIRASVPKWDEGQHGILPIPDEEVPAARGYRRYWRRGTLAAHQATRPGKGAGAGRPPRATT